MKPKHILSALLALSVCHYSSAVVPNAKVSAGKPAFTSYGVANYLTDNVFGGTTFYVNNNTWLAVNLGSSRTKVFFSWNNTSYTWSDVISAATSCKSQPAIPVNYIVQVSSNSTNGQDGSWTDALTVTGNTVSARGHIVDLSGASWIRMNISTGSGAIDELEIFDLAGGGTDLWFFPGTSISANTYKGTPPASNFADLVTAAHPAFTPAMVRGGIPCINSTTFKDDVSKYLAVAGNVRYWAIEMGTNDAWGGTNGGVATFKTNMQAIITACRNAGVEPIIARMLSTNAAAAGWQVHADYLQAIDDLAAANNLIAGPDLYTYFLAHPGELSTDGVHPIAAGAASIQRLWAEKMASVYAAVNPKPTLSITSPANNATASFGTAVNITVSADISSGTVKEVRYFDGANLLGTSTLSPFTYSAAGLAIGTHSLKAVAISNYDVASDTTRVSVEILAPSIQLETGWNLVGCPLHGSVSVQDALSSIWANVESVKNENGFYLSTTSPIFNTLNTLEWGKGYFVKVNAPCTLDWSVAK